MNLAYVLLLILFLFLILTLNSLKKKNLFLRKDKERIKIRRKELREEKVLKKKNFLILRNIKNKERINIKSKNLKRNTLFLKNSSLILNLNYLIRIFLLNKEVKSEEKEKEKENLKNLIINSLNSKEKERNSRDKIHSGRDFVSLQEPFPSRQLIFNAVINPKDSEKRPYAAARRVYFMKRVSNWHAQQWA